MRRFSLAIAILSLVQADAWDSAEGPAVVPWAGPRPQPPPPPSPDRPSPPNKDLIDYDAFLDTSYDKDDGLYDSYDGGCPRNLHNCPSNVSTDIIRGAGERNAPLQCQPASPPAATHTTVRPC